MRDGYEYIALNDFGQMVVRLFTDRAEFVAFVKTKGLKQICEVEEYPEGGIRLHASLIGQPVFDGLVGPMVGNHNSIRYETPEVYERLSR
jgi:hypothetical protein